MFGHGNDPQVELVVLEGVHNVPQVEMALAAELGEAVIAVLGVEHILQELEDAGVGGVEEGLGDLVLGEGLVEAFEGMIVGLLVGQGHILGCEDLFCPQIRSRDVFFGHFAPFSP